MYVGLDVHKKYDQACIMDESGNVVREQKFLNTIEELDGFLAELPEDSKIVMEACSVWEPIFDYIEEKGFDVCLAHLLRANLLPKSYVPTSEVRKLRFIVSHRASLVKIQTMVKNKIHALLWKEGISTELTDLFGKTGWKALQTIELKPQHRFALNNYLKLLELLKQCIKDTEDYTRRRHVLCCADLRRDRRCIEVQELQEAVQICGSYSFSLPVWKHA